MKARPCEGAEPATVEMRRKQDALRDGPSQRQLRVAEAIRHAIVAVLERGEVHDPAVAGVAVTVTEVSISPDLRNATVYVVPLAGRGTETVVAALRRAAPFIRHRIADAVRLRHVPNLRFEADTGFDRASRIDRLLRDPRAAGDDDGA